MARRPWPRRSAGARQRPARPGHQPRRDRVRAWRRVAVAGAAAALVAAALAAWAAAGRPDHRATRPPPTVPSTVDSAPAGTGRGGLASVAGSASASASAAVPRLLFGIGTEATG